jgi:hypothetical protein
MATPGLQRLVSVSFLTLGIDHNDACHVIRNRRTCLVMNMLHVNLLIFAMFIRKHNRKFLTVCFRSHLLNTSPEVHKSRTRSLPGWLNFVQ